MNTVPFPTTELDVRLTRIEAKQDQILKTLGQLIRLLAEEQEIAEGPTSTLDGDKLLGERDQNEPL